jgi:hypothetical protein
MKTAEHRSGAEIGPSVGSVDRMPEMVTMPAADVDHAKEVDASLEPQRDDRSPIVDIRDEPDVSRPPGRLRHISRSAAM